jgi:hypothetical protein
VLIDPAGVKFSHSVRILPKFVSLRAEKISQGTTWKLRPTNSFLSPMTTLDSLKVPSFVTRLIVRQLAILLFSASRGVVAVPSGWS